MYLVIVVYKLGLSLCQLYSWDYGLSILYSEIILMTLFLGLWLKYLIQWNCTYDNQQNEMAVTAVSIVELIERKQQQIELIVKILVHKMKYKSVCCIPWNYSIIAVFKKCLG